MSRGGRKLLPKNGQLVHFICLLKRRVEGVNNWKNVLRVVSRGSLVFGSEDGFVRSSLNDADQCFFPCEQLLVN